MKKLLSAIVLFLSLAYSARSQSPQFGITAGGTMSYYQSAVEGPSHTSNMTPGFSAGVIASFPLAKTFVFQPSIQFLQKGGTESQEGNTATLHISYIDLPLNFLYVAKGNSGNFEIGLGPCLSYGVGGKISLDYSNTHGSGSIKFGDENDYFQNAFEFSGNFVMGYQWKSGLLLQANYNLGFTNLWSGVNAEDGSHFKNGYIGLRFGYLFGKK